VVVQSKDVRLRPPNFMPSEYRRPVPGQDPHFRVQAYPTISTKLMAVTHMEHDLLFYVLQRSGSSYSSRSVIPELGCAASTVVICRNHYSIVTFRPASRSSMSPRSFVMFNLYALEIWAAVSPVVAGTELLLIESPMRSCPSSMDSHL
jgi:hypothetical protein